MSKIKEKIAQVKEYRRLKKMANKWWQCANRFYSKNVNAELNINGWLEVPDPEVAPTNFGERGVPCKVIQVNTGELNPYVLDYNTRPEKQYSFSCPHFNEATPCGICDCHYNTENKKLFYYDDKYNQATKKYAAAKARANAVRAKIFGRVK